MARPTSMLGRLLSEVSWEGNARHYREGGRGFENVLSAEVFQALDFLPRTAFLGNVIRTAVGASGALGLLADEIERANVSLLPGDIVLARNAKTDKASLTVQPDVIIETASVYCLVEAKRIRRCSFQVEQLAREYVAALSHADGRSPLVLLVLPEAPPVPVRGHGRVSVHEAVASRLEAVMGVVDSDLLRTCDVEVLVDSVFAYTTWSRIDACVEGGSANFALDDSVGGCVSRLANAARESISWHS